MDWISEILEAVVLVVFELLPEMFLKGKPRNGQAVV